jgi:hypothetical protein
MDGKAAEDIPYLPKALTFFLLFQDMEISIAGL